jgi:hypothetical protein
VDQRPRPEVTVTDPARPGVRFEAAPVQDERRPPSPHRRRWQAGAVALVLAGAAVLVGQDVAEQRRRDRVVDVVLAGPLLPPASWSYDRTTRTATLETFLRLRNTGPRPVRVVSARLGELRFSGDAALPAGTGTAVIALTRTVRCPDDGSQPPREPAVGDAVDLGVVTPAGSRRVRLPTRMPDGATARFGASSACGYSELEDAVRVLGTVMGGADATGRVPVRVAVVSTSQRRTQLVSIAFARGLELLELDDGATVLPVALERAPLGTRAVRTVDALVGISCSALIASGGIRLGDLDVLVEDVDEQDLAQVTGRITDPAVLRQAVRRTCTSSG